MIYYDGIVSSLQKTGGISIYFDNLIKRLARDHIEFEIHNYGNGLSSQNMRSNSCILNSRSRVFERYRKSPCSRRASLFHSTYYRRPVASGIATVTTVHDFTYERKIGGLRSFVHSQQKFASIKHADAVICVSESTRKDLLELIPWCDERKIHVVHNGVSEEYYPVGSVDSAREGRAPFLLFVGARQGYKNFDLAVRVAARAGNLSLVAVGGGALSVQEKALVEKFLPGRFRHDGYVSNEHLNRLYNYAHALLYPSSYEGFGIPIVEAMRAGCPVIAISTSSIPEVGGEAALLANMADEDELLSLINSLHDAIFRNKVVIKGLQWANNFSWEKTYRETLNVYRLVADV